MANATETAQKTAGGAGKLFFYATIAILVIASLFLVPEEGGLNIHPMDQFIVEPLFPDYEPVVAVDEHGLGVLADGSVVVLSPEMAAAVALGETVEVPSQALHWYTPTNVTLWMAIAVLGIVLLTITATRGRAVIPSRGQSLAELSYGFVHKMVEDVAGKDGLKYFPYIMTLFLFILFANMLALIPMSFSVTSHIAVTAVLAFAVFFTVTAVGFIKNGASFLELFWVSSAPLALRPILAVIEVISYFVRPVSHSIRLAGNIMAGHAVLKVFAGFAGALGIGAFVPILAITAIYALELLVAFIQAYVFTILTCVYLKDALHPHH